MKKSVHTPYDWFDYLFIQSFAIVILIFGSNKVVVIPIGILLSVLGFVKSFRTAKIMEDEFFYYSLLAGRKKYSWEQVLKIKYSPSLRTKARFTFYMNGGEKLFFFSNEETLEFIEKISMKNNIKWNG